MGKRKRVNYIEYTSRRFTSLCNQVYQKVKLEIEDIEKNVDGFGNYDLQLHNDSNNLEENERFFIDGIVFFSRIQKIRVVCKFYPVKDTFDFIVEGLSSKFGEVVGGVSFNSEILKLLTRKSYSYKEVVDFLK